MATRDVEIFSAGCPLCEDTIEMVRRIACDACDITVLDVNDDYAADRAVALGVRAIPAVAIDGDLAACCEGKGVSEEALRRASAHRSARRDDLRLWTR